MTIKHYPQIEESEYNREMNKVHISSAVGLYVIFHKDHYTHACMCVNAVTPSIV